MVMDQARAKGFGTSPEDIIVAEKIALLHTELSEAYEAYRHKNMDGKHGFTEELGDVMQRLLHLAGIFGVDLEQAIVEKIEANKTREWKGINERLGTPE